MWEQDGLLPWMVAAWPMLPASSFSFSLYTSAAVPWRPRPTVSCSGGGLVTKSCPTLATLWTVARQAPLSTGFPKQECWTFLTQGLNPGDLHCRQILYHLSHQGSPDPLQIKKAGFLREKGWLLKFTFKEKIASKSVNSWKMLLLEISHWARQQGNIFISSLLSSRFLVSKRGYSHL